ncbi:hypothetical protein [Streptomyces sp. FH025]|uniref:hypothetical protein n=1 Tax=Streptomyces sp. FH025 TaxID=2815937 RepID=UPI001A9F4C80|nr:hypothetical protein [Streptomyces sp. FH025]MBO1419514.1 hypothetical protein [Streptomyces sp. FH025]
MEIVVSAGIAGGAWPELMPDRRPVLVVPAAVANPVVAEEGWVRDAGALEQDPAPGWSIAADPPHLTVRRPAGEPWFDGRITAGREWWRALRAYETLLVVTGPFTGVLDFRPAAAAGALALLTVRTVTEE